MATVYRGRDEFLGRDVAVKVVQKTVSNGAQLRHDDAEVKVLARLNHHGLVTLLDAGIDLRDLQLPGIYLVMELIDGPDLRRHLSQGPMPPRDVAQIGYELAEGLEYMHRQGVVHRDIKPANVMLFDYQTETSRVRAKLTDFGIAQMVHSKQIDDGGLSGTAAYLSPEQARSETVGPPSDVYSLGLVLLECLTGEPAFPGEALQSALARLIQDPVIPAEIGPEWSRLLKAMTNAEPADRPSTRDVAMALYDRVVAGRGRRKIEAPMAEVEDQRMEAVHRYELLDTPADGAFDRITSLAARLFSVPIAIVSVVDHDRIWFKSHHGTDVEQIGRDPGLCASAILQEDPWIVNDAGTDPRTLANPLVAGDFGLRFYAGVPLRTRDGHNLGTLCVLDREPRSFDAADRGTLEDLAAVVMNDLELRLESRQAAR